MLTKFNFLDIWANLFRLDEMKIVCGNVLLIVEILLTTLFLNAIVEMVFSKRNCIKTDTRYQLSQERLENQLHIGEEGVNIEQFNTDTYIKNSF